MTENFFFCSKFNSFLLLRYLISHVDVEFSNSILDQLDRITQSSSNLKNMIALMFSLIERHLATYIHVLFFDQIDHQSIFISIQIQKRRRKTFLEKISKSFHLSNACLLQISARVMNENSGCGW